jgi:signal peptidase complex subunit 2
MIYLVLLISGGRYDDMYELFMCCTNGLNGVTTEASFTKSVADFFDDNGYLCDALFEEEVLKLHSSLTPDKKMQ